jgi:hypothetical protein
VVQNPDGVLETIRKNCLVPPPLDPLPQGEGNSNAKSSHNSQPDP